MIYVFHHFSQLFSNSFNSCTDATQMRIYMMCMYFFFFYIGSPPPHQLGQDRCTCVGTVAILAQIAHWALAAKLAFLPYNSRAMPFCKLGLQGSKLSHGLRRSLWWNAHQLPGQHAPGDDR